MAVEEPLVEVPAVEPADADGDRGGKQRVPAGVAGTKVFRDYDQDQALLLPPSLADWLPQDHTARFIDEVVEELLDLSPILVAYDDERGAPPYDPRLMLKILLYGYATGRLSSRKIARACIEDLAFRFLTANQQPDFRSIARFRQRHLAAIEDLYVQVLQIAYRAGLVELGQVALDGTKLRADASRHKAMSYERMSTREQQLQAEIEELHRQVRAQLDGAEEADQAEDAQFGEGVRGDELPAELASRQERLSRIQAAKQQLEAEAAEAAAERERDKARRRARRDAERAAAADGCDDDETEARAADAEQAADADPTVEQAAEDAAAHAEPKPKAQRNFTDPDSRIMKMSDGAFHQGYNAQALIDGASQMIVASTVSNQANDAPHLPALLDQLEANLGVGPGQLLADAGYFSEANVAACTAREIDAVIATGRFKHHEPAPPAPRGPIPKHATVKQRMSRKLKTKPGRAAYARRKAIVEPVFGQQDTRQRARRLMLRGLDKAHGERKLHDLVHNLLKMATADVELQPAPS